MLRNYYFLPDRFGSSPYDNFFKVDLGWFPFSLVFERRILEIGIDSLKECVCSVDNGVCYAPRNVAIVANDHSRNTWETSPDNLENRTVKVHFVPD